MDRTTGILADLVEVRICNVESNPDRIYRYAPFTAELDLLVGSLERYYSQNLIDVTNMIHENLRRHFRIREFADAFKWDKKK